jgi:uncharacterized membrane protein YphA (DoxX/SURF4 family)
MNALKRNQILYWVVTLSVLLPTTGSGVPEVFTRGPQSTIHAYQTLGYPLYLMKILGTAKILGAIAILIGRPARIVEWAYAGFAILFLGATASHMLAGDTAHAPVPFVFFALLAGSYVLREKSKKRLP